MIATSGFLTALECTELVFGRGSAPDPAEGAYSAPPNSLAGLTGMRGKGEWKEEGEGGGRNYVDPLHLYFLRTPLQRTVGRPVSFASKTTSTASSHTVISHSPTSRKLQVTGTFETGLTTYSQESIQAVEERRSRRHVTATTSPGRPCTCPQCNRVGASEFGLRSHLRSHITPAKMHTGVSLLDE